MTDDERFRFRIHRSSILDTYTVECFVTFDGKVEGFVRNRSNNSGFIHFEFMIPRSKVGLLKELFMASSSTLESTAINIGYGAFYAPLEVKHFPIPGNIEDKDPTASECFRQFEAICQSAIQLAEKVAARQILDDSI